ncbi:MAG: aminotransferase class V-fold PLP-dependent enzyme, partial [Acidobacteriota bacterium]
QDLAQRSGALLRTVLSPPDNDWTSRIVEAISKKTAVVAIPNCHWTDGSTIDLVTVGERARAADATFVVDGSQSIGAIELSVAEIEPDFVITGTYKWLLGPYSQALMWVSPRYRQGRPLEHNSISRANSRDFSALVEYTDELNRGARRYDVGEVSNFGLIPASLAALEQTLEWTVDAVSATLHQLVELLAKEAEQLGLGVCRAENRGRHMIGLRLLGRDARPLLRRLSDARVFVSLRGDSIRVAPHVYNQASDIDRLLELLEEFVASASSAGSSTPIQAGI